MSLIGSLALDRTDEDRLTGGRGKRGLERGDSGSIESKATDLMFESPISHASLPSRPSPRVCPKNRMSF
ncbi:MAG: hypothetical protein EA369_00485 [Bradymonadales bacterium]|nr:MAG: hypothetical protein EA369_00485 [Bradymonadales bacterium]